MALSLFRLVGAVGRTMVLSSTIGNFTMLVLFVLGGFVISKDYIKPWWEWAYLASPMMYGQNAIALNEFLDPRWSTPNNDSSIDALTVGKTILKSRGMFVDDSWYWICIRALIGFSFLFNACFILALSYIEVEFVLLWLSIQAGTEGHCMPNSVITDTLKDKLGFKVIDNWEKSIW